MPNRNYLTGRAYEYKAKRVLEEQGYTVIRTAGSHGPWDLVATREGEKVRCIQIKRTKSPGACKRLLGAFLKQVPQEEHFIQELWVYEGARWHTSHFPLDKEE